MKKLFVTSCIWLLGTSFSIMAEVKDLSFTKKEYGKFEKAEATFKLTEKYVNPYDPDVIKVDAKITEPDGNTYLMPCFYYIPATFTKGAGQELKDKATWMLRFSPQKEGKYKVAILTKDKSNEEISNEVYLNVKENGKSGFIKVNKDNKYALNFDNGSQYYPVGYNIAWNNYWSDGRFADFYKDYYKKMGDNNQTWTRYWFTGFAKQALEWGAKTSDWYEGLGKYSQRAAGILDEAVNSAEENGLYIQLVFQHHGQYSRDTNPNWDDNPYNVANGGYLDKPSDFFTNEEAKKQTKKMYRYIVARWGYSPNIFAWELFNEVHFSEGKPKVVDAWHDEMATYLKSIDPYKHIVTSSMSEAQLKLMDDNKDMDILQYHVYEANLDTTLVEKVQKQKEKLSKPIIVGEFGSNLNTDDYSKHPDKEFDHVRKGAWINIFTEVPHLFWFWDQIYAQNKFNLLKPLANFVKDINLSKMNPITPEIKGGKSSNQFTSFAPGKGWEAMENNKVEISSSGEVLGAAELSRYLQGQWHKDMGTSYVVNYDSKNDGEALIKISEVSPSGSKKIRVTLDGIEAGVYEITEPVEIKTNLKAGKHTLVYENVGQDWINVNAIKISGTSSSDYKAYGLKNTDSFAAFVYDTRYGEWSTKAETVPKGLAISTSGMNNGKYNITFVNTITGEVKKSIVEVKNGLLEVELPEFYKEITIKTFQIK